MTIDSFKEYINNNFNIKPAKCIYVKNRELTLQDDIEISKAFVNSLEPKDVIEYGYYLKELNIIYYTFFRALKKTLRKSNFDIFLNYYNTSNATDYYSAKRNDKLYTKPIKFFLDIAIKLYRSEKQTLEGVISFLKEHYELEEFKYCNKSIFRFFIKKLEEIKENGGYTI